MNNKTKLILTVIGLAAIVVPAILLIVFASPKSGDESSTVVPAGTRQIDKGAIQNEVNKNTPPQVVASPIVSPIPSPSSSPAAKTQTSNESTSSGAQ